MTGCRSLCFSVLFVTTFGIAAAPKSQIEGVDHRGFVSGAPATLRKYAGPLPRGAAPFRLKPGNIYATESFKSDILQISPEGEVVATLTIPNYQNGFKGMAFGPDGTLYLVAVSNNGYDLLELDESGAVLRARPGVDYVFGNLSFGKLAVSRDQTVHVGGQNNLRQFRQNAPSGEVIYSNNQIYDVTTLPNGNLMVASAYYVEEITTDGTLVRNVGPQFLFTDIRGLLYLPATDDVYVTMLGHSDNYFRILRINGTTGVLELNQPFWYADDLTQTSTGELIVGSRTQAPGRFSTDLVQSGSLQTDERMFVVVMPDPILQYQNGFE